MTAVSLIPPHHLVSEEGYAWAVAAMIPSQSQSHWLEILAVLMGLYSQNEDLCRHHCLESAIQTLIDLGVGIFCEMVGTASQDQFLLSD